MCSRWLRQHKLTAVAAAGASAIAHKDWTRFEMCTFEGFHFGPQRFLLLLDLLQPLSPHRFLYGRIPRTRSPHLSPQTFGKQIFGLVFLVRKSTGAAGIGAPRCSCLAAGSKRKPVPLRDPSPSPDCRLHVLVPLQLILGSFQASLLAN